MWMKKRQIWRFPQNYNHCKSFTLPLPKTKGSSINVHALLLSNGRLLFAIMPGTDGQSCFDFVNKHVSAVKDFLIVHDGLASNRMKRVINEWKSKGATTLCTPSSACALSSVETIFAIVKARFRKWLGEDPGSVT